MNYFLNWPKIIQEKKNHLIQVSVSGVDLLWCQIFCCLELCGARKYICGQDYVDPPQGLSFLGVRGFRQNPMKWGYGHVLCDRTLRCKCSVFIKGLYEKIQTRTIAQNIFSSFHKEHRNHPSANTEATQSFKKETVIQNFTFKNKFN